MHSGITEVISTALCGVSLPGHRASDEHVVSHTNTGNGSGRLMFGRVEEMKTNKDGFPKAGLLQYTILQNVFWPCVFSLECAHVAKISVGPCMYFPCFFQE